MKEQKKYIITHIKKSKICPACNRIFYNRKKWKLRGIWDEITYCSNTFCKNIKKLQRFSKRNRQ